MPSELQRVAQGLVECLDQIPEVVGRLQHTAMRLRQQASWIADLASSNPYGRQAALLLDDAARRCDDAAYRASLAPPTARAWAQTMVGGGGGHGQLSGRDAATGPAAAGRSSITDGSGRSGAAAASASAGINVAAILQRLPKRVARPGQKAKTRGIWIDQAGREHELISGQHEPEHQAAQQHAEHIGLVRPPAKLATAADVELKFAMRMRREGITSATIVLNNRPCPGELGCNALLPRFLPPGSQLTIYAPDGFKKTYRAEQGNR